MYHQGNDARQFQLEFEIAQYTQGTLSIQEYYSRFLPLWSEYDEIKYANVSQALLPVQQESHRDQFLMKLCSEFEIVRSSLMSRAMLPSFDDCLQELLCEEQSQMTKATLEQKLSDKQSCTSCLCC